MRYMGIDLGSVRTGLSVSDPVGVTCRPLEVVEERDEGRLIAHILEVVENEGVGEVVVGVPRPLSGGTNAQSEHVQAFTRRLAERARIPVVSWDERFTSKLAERGRKSKAPADAVAACHLLQSYLDSQALRRRDAGDGGVGD